MHKAIKDFFEKEKIEYFGVVPVSECSITRGYLLEREAGFTPRSVVCYAVPYYTEEGVNISAYAVSRDYHRYMQLLSSRLCELLSHNFRDSRSFGFCDHSPVSEPPLAAKCGLGVVGDNGLLITEKYSSFVFIGEVITDIDASMLGYTSAEDIKTCIKCGNCKKHCPTGRLSDSENECLSAITQKKGMLSREDECLIAQNATAWGCDICQNVCPYTQSAKKNNTIVTPISYFHKNKIAELTANDLAEMDEIEFALRAYSWRKRETIKRNLVLLEKAHDDKLSEIIEGE